MSLLVIVVLHNFLCCRLSQVSLGKEITDLNGTNPLKNELNKIKNKITTGLNNSRNSESPFIPSYSTCSSDIQSRRTQLQGGAD